MNDEKPQARLEVWQFNRDRDYLLEGYAYGHPHVPEGWSIITSIIVEKPDEPKEGDVVETINISYVLGIPYPGDEL